ncbi:tyrosine phosphatase family protein [Methylocapsa sp. S129]|uniref:tyrosine phosphatase family protein n=1 Tax=Methylocapsa sp. S129 TaxID=1641869 RepID=UPI00131E3227|nr:protein tyrosine phosphatase [Methylocapsa sp. S129]
MNLSTTRARVHVCSLARIGEAVEETGARSLVTLLNNGTPVTRPPAIRPERHLFIAMSDIIDPMEGHILPAERHVRDLLRFVGDWDRSAPLLIHCFAGVSRSTAAAFITACALGPTCSESEIAKAIRAASPTATPNSRLVAVADSILGRSGRMTDAVATIGRGETCEVGVPFGLEVG